MLERRDFLTRSSALMVAGAAASLTTLSGVRTPLAAVRQGDAVDWEAVRAQFALSRDKVHMSAMLLSSHPEPVREAIETHRKGLDEDTVAYLGRHYTPLTRSALDAAGRYLGVAGGNIALTDSTTAGVGLVYNGLKLGEGDEILCSNQDYFVTHESVRLAAERTGAGERRFDLWERGEDITAELLVERITDAIRPETRVLGMTWVHSSTGLKLPLAQISKAIGEINADRDEEDRVLIVVDGVHGFGNQDTTLDDLGCDFLAAGCHKWLFGPRGTGIVAATRRGLDAVRPTIPSFIDNATWSAWLHERDPGGRVDGRAMTPGGFKAFEHVWALTPAFEWHDRIGKAAIAKRTAVLASRLKEGLSGIYGVTVQTPMPSELSAGIVFFDVDGLSATGVVGRLGDRGIVASAAPYPVSHARLTPSIRNTPEEVDKAIEAVQAIAG